MALIAVHLGVIDEEQIDNMSYLFFEDVLEQLGKKLSYDAIVNYAGNSFCKDSYDMILKANPMISDSHAHNKSQQAFADFFGRGARIAGKEDLEKMKSAAQQAGGAKGK